MDYIAKALRFACNLVGSKSSFEEHFRLSDRSNNRVFESGKEEAVGRGGKTLKIRGF